MLPSDFPTEKLARQRFLSREQDMREAFAKRAVVDLSKNKDVKAFVKKFDPSYRKRKVGFAIGATEVTLFGGFWDGGSRTEWFGVHGNGSRYPLTYPTAPPQFGGGKPPKIKIQPDKFVAQGGTSLGKPATLTFHVTAEFAQAMGVSA